MFIVLSKNVTRWIAVLHPYGGSRASAAPAGLKGAAKDWKRARGAVGGKGGFPPLPPSIFLYPGPPFSHGTVVCGDVRRSFSCDAECHRRPESGGCSLLGSKPSYLFPRRLFAVMPSEHLPSPRHGLSNLHTPHAASPTRESESARIPRGRGSLCAPPGPSRSSQCALCPTAPLGQRCRGFPSAWAEGGGSPLLACIHTCIHTYTRVCVAATDTHTPPAVSPPPAPRHLPTPPRTSSTAASGPPRKGQREAVLTPLTSSRPPRRSAHPNFRPHALKRGVSTQIARRWFAGGSGGAGGAMPAGGHAAVCVAA